MHRDGLNGLVYDVGNVTCSSVIEVKSIGLSMICPVTEGKFQVGGRCFVSITTYQVTEALRTINHKELEAEYIYSRTGESVLIYLGQARPTYHLNLF